MKFSHYGLTYINFAYIDNNDLEHWINTRGDNESGRFIVLYTVQFTDWNPRWRSNALQIILEIPLVFITL